MRATEGLIKLLAEYTFSTVLDIGSGEGEQSRIFAEYGKIVDGVDLQRAEDMSIYRNFYEQMYDETITEQYDVVWCSHLLEHVSNVEVFLKQLQSNTKPDGTIAITVPPYKTDIVGGHLTIWNEGLLLYNLIMSGLDCSQARVKRYGYNITVLVPNTPIRSFPTLRRDKGDIEILAPYFPEGRDWKQGFNGNIEEINW